MEQFLGKFADIVTERSGEIVSRDTWGRRRLAYPIQKQHEGVFVLLYIRMDPAVVSQLNTLCRVEVSVMRHMFVKKDPVASKPAESSSKPTEVTHEEQPAAGPQ